MGSEQSNQQGTGPSTSKQKQTSPRPSIGSDDIPYVSYTVNRPIGDSPKLQSKHMHTTLRSATPSPRKSPKPQRPRSMTGHDIVVVQEAVEPEDSPENDSELCRLQTIPTFLPIMRGALNIPTMTDVDVLDKLDYTSILAACSRYQDHLKQCSELVSCEQNTLATRVREIDFVISTLTNLLIERQKKYAKYAEKLSKVHEISSTLKRCNMTLKQTMESMETLNAMLPPGEQLEPFVWTTG